MSLPTFAPSRAPSVDAQMETKARVLEAGFGDGYSQRAGDGLNVFARTLTLTWDNCPASVATEIDTFMRARRGYLAFLFQLPDESTPAKWICKNWRLTYQRGDRRSFWCQLEQVFDL